ncbi:MAG: isopeptide-forming domain-containing fimbrial protein, partial [Casimicrobiaceae bacterium]|nr:isopeptide-forming domain-containing fimbrial protein [Casimicrobiaceae bacterium]
MVNTYYPPASSSSTQTYSGTVTIPLGTSSGATTPIAPGDLVLVIQMQCANINSTNSAAYGAGGTTGRGYSDPTGSCLAGRYEFVRAEPGSSASQLVATLVNTYVQDPPTATNRRTFQVIRVPQYSSVTLSGTVTAPYWNGSTGGVVVLDVAGQLNWNGGTIDVSGRGFRGGVAPDQSGFNETGAAAPWVSNNSTPHHGGKGEGIAGTPRYVWDPVGNAIVDLGASWGGYAGGNFGRGAPGNAGGGGDNYNSSRDNAGGGGGGNGGIGGYGGLGWRGAGWSNVSGYPDSIPDTSVENTSSSPQTAANLRGIGGGAFLAPSTSRLVMGGGGGGGAENNNSPGTYAYGGSGGGIVLVRAGSMIGSGSILANGAPGGTQTLNDAAGGGGAGGSVLVWSLAGPVTTGTLSIRVQGGAGGDSF